MCIPNTYRRAFNKNKFKDRKTMNLFQANFQFIFV